MRKNLRQIFEDTLYRMRVGCPWRDLPEYFGKPNTGYKAYKLWFRSNKLTALFTLLLKYSDLELVFMHGTHIKAHQHRSGGNKNMQGISKSATKIHLAVAAHSNPITFILPDSTTHDVKVASHLSNQIYLSNTATVCVDKGYDSYSLRVHIKQAGCCDNILRRRKNKFTNSHMDWHLYKARHLVENAFAKLKNYRAVPQDLISSSKVIRIRWLLLIFSGNYEHSTRPNKIF